MFQNVQKQCQQKVRNRDITHILPEIGFFLPKHCLHVSTFSHVCKLEREIKPQNKGVLRAGLTYISYKTRHCLTV